MNINYINVSLLLCSNPYNYLYKMYRFADVDIVVCALVIN